MATNTTATTQNHNGTGSQNNFAISFAFLANTEVDVKVNGVLKTLGTHYNIVGSQVQFTSGNTPPSGTANIVFTRDTDISAKKVDFADGSVLTETDLDNNSDQILFAQQEFTNDFVKRDGSNTITGNLVFEGATDDDNETTLAITDPTADRTITVPDITGTLITTADTGTVSHTMLANDAVDGDNIADDSINSEHYVSLSIDTEHIANENVTTAKLENNAVVNSKLADNAVDSRNYVDGSIDHEHLANDVIDSDNIQDNAINSEHYVDGSIDHEHLANDIIDGDNIQDDVINSEHYVAGSIDHEHLANDIIDGDNIQDNAINNEHIAANAVRVNEIKNAEITVEKLNPSAVITSAEQATATTNDTSFLTSAAADARFFNISTGDTIKDGQTFPDNDTTIATTAAINDRIIDLIDDVGGFTIIASEQAFPNVNPQGVTGQAAVLSIKAATTNLVPSGTTVTVVNGNVADNANITITGVPSTIPSGFGFLVESTTTLHTYSFHRLVPKATEVTTVAGKATEIGRLGTADAVADMAILGTADVVADMNTLATADIVSDMNALAVADVISDMNTLAVADVISDMDTVATNVTNVNNVGNNITNVNSVSNSAGANQTFTVTVQNVSGNKYFIDGVQTPVLKLARGKTYTFDMSDSSNSGHPLAFRDSSDNSYTTGVTTSGTAGNSGATVTFVVPSNAPSSLKYYCTSHGNAMGNTINVIDDNVGVVAGSITNVNTVGGAISNVNTVGGAISNVNTVASNISSVNSFANTYRIGANNPTTSLDTGDLFFNTTSNSLKVYTGSAWVDGVTATGNFAVVTGNTFTGSNRYNDTVKAEFGTSADLQIFHDGTDSHIADVGTGALNINSNFVAIKNAADNENVATFDDNAGVDLYYDNVKKFETTSSGVSVTGNIAVSGNVDGRDVAADGSKLDGIEANAINASNAAITNKLPLAGGTLTGNLTISNTQPAITFTDSNHNPDYKIQNADGGLIFNDTTNQTNRLVINTDGHIDVTGNLDVGAGLDVTGNITVTGTVDGVDIAALNATVSNITTDLVSDTSPQLGGALDTNGNNIDFGTNDKAIFGDNDQLKIYYDGSNSVITAGGNGDLNLESIYDDILIQAADNIFIKPQGGEDGIKVLGDGAVELYHDGTKRLETTALGVKSEYYTGEDNAQLRLGDSGDLQISHSGGINLINLATAANLDIKYGSEYVARFGPNGSCELYYDNSKKLETYSGGVYITGRLKQSGSNADFLIEAVGAGGHVKFVTTGADRWYVEGTNGHFLPTANNTYDIGNTSYRVRNIYTNDLNLSNEGSSNDVDGTWGSYTIQEGEESLFLINKRNGKKYKFNLTEVS